jgi:hypothetical protein
VIKNLSGKQNYKNPYIILDIKDIKMHTEDKLEWKKYILLKYTTPTRNGIQCIGPTQLGHIFMGRSNFEPF